MSLVFRIILITWTVSYYSTADETFDVLIFSQHWPKTLCAQWEEKDENNLCTIPDHDLWTVHGIWPTKAGHDIGPSNCNKSSKFDPSKLSPIENDLDQFWTNIEANTGHYSFWKHEWDKHGTCAAQLSELDNELKYFERGLIWNKNYNIRDILGTNSIVPSDTPYTAEGIYLAVQTLIDKRPILQCVFDSERKELLISEIRLCFNKSLDLVDCDLFTLDGVDGILTNCDLNKPVFYIDNLIGELGCSDRNVELEQAYTQKLLLAHEILQFLIWLTI